MKKWVRKNYTIESTFLLCKIDYYIYPISYHGKMYTVRLERLIDALYGSIYSYKEDAKHHCGKKLYFTDIPCIIRDNSIFIDKNIDTPTCLYDEDIFMYLPQLINALFEFYKEKLKEEEIKKKKIEINEDWDGTLDREIYCNQLDVQIKELTTYNGLSKTELLLAAKNILQSMEEHTCSENQAVVATSDFLLFLDAVNGLARTGKHPSKEFQKKYIGILQEMLGDIVKEVK